MKEVPLTQGKTALVPDECYNELSQFKWYAHQERKRCYAIRQNNSCRHIRLHRVVFEMLNGPIPKGMEIDHIDGNGLNNCIENLRICTHQQNQCNQHLDRSGRKTKFRGVRIYGNRYGAIIKQTWIGMFDSEEEAAKAYDTKAKEYFGEFAILNFKEDK